MSATDNKIDDLEDGEIELSEEEIAAALRVAPTADGERVVAPSSSGRAPYFSVHENNDPSVGGGSNVQPTTATGKKLKKKGWQPEMQLKWQPGSFPIKLGDVQDLILSVYTPHPNPRFCSIKNGDKVPKVVLVAAHGIYQALLKQHPVINQQLQELFGSPIDLQARSPILVPAQTVHGLLLLPARQKNIINVKRRRSEAEMGGNYNTGEVQQQQQQQQQQHQLEEGEAAPAPPPAKRIKVNEHEDVAAQHVATGLVDNNNTTTQQAVNNNGAAAPHHLNTTKNTPIAPPAPPRPPLPPPKDYVLTLEQLEYHGYPLPQYTDDGQLLCPEGFVATQPCQPTGSAPQHDMVAVDCEMCTTAIGLELTRVTLTSKNGDVLLDELVVPDNPITNYQTQFSGITAAMLEGVETRLVDVQQKVLRVVSAETLVVAHSGENDLKALKIIHANMIDTSVLYPHPRGPPAKSALRILATRFLRRTIQTKETGHSPIEDARAAMDLVLLKIEKGPTYGTSTVERGEKLTDALTAARRRSSLLDNALTLPKYVGGNCNAIAAGSDGEVVEKGVREVAKEGVEFVWMQFTALDNLYTTEVASLLATSASSDDTTSTAPPPPPTVAPIKHATREAVLSTLVNNLRQLYNAAPPNTFFIVVTGQGNSPYQRYLNDQRHTRQQPESTHKWTLEDEEMWRNAGQDAVSTVCYMKVKES